MSLYFRRTIVLLALIVLAVVYFKSDRDNSRFPVLIDGRVGYINAKGILKINPTYEEAQYFSEGLAGIVIKGNCGFIDKKGDIAVPLKYRNVKPFSEGLAAVATRDDSRGCLWGYINQSGRVIIKPEYTLAGPFSNGMAFVRKVFNSDKAMPGYINLKGVFTPLPEGMAKGRDFSEGLAFVRGASPGGFIGKDCRFRTGQNFCDGAKFHEGLASAAEHPGKYGFINRSGVFVIAPQYNCALDFNDGIAPVMKNGKFGYIDRKGKYSIPPVFDSADSFTKENVARVTINGKYGFIDRKGRLAVQPTFDWIGLPENGLWPYSRNGVEGYMNKKGGIIWSRPETTTKRSALGIWDDQSDLQ